jgi:hypothetical protein
MSGPDFFQTVMGKRFYEGTVPAIARSLEGIHEELIRQNDLKEKELNPLIVTEPEPEPEPEIEYESNPVSELRAIRAYLAKNTTTLPPCPSCKANNSVGDDGMNYICRFCEHTVSRD